MRGRGALRPRDRLQERRHRRVPARPQRPLRLHRDEPAHPGRAHRDRGDHGRRPRPVADADRGRRDPRRPRPDPGLRAAARLRAAVPDHHRGSRQRLPARHRQDHDLPLPRRAGRAPRRRYDVLRRRDQPALRLDARQAHLSRPHLRVGGAEGAPRAAGVPDPRRLHQRRLPPGRAGRPRLRRRRRDDLLHRGPPAAAQGPGRRRPRLAPADLPRRRHCQPAARPGAGLGVTHQQAAAARPLAADAGRHPPAAPRARTGGVRPAAARPGPGRRHRHDVPRRPPVAARHAGAHARPPRRRGARLAHHPRAVVGRVLGRGDVRRRAALPLRGPVGAAGRPARGDPQHRPADAAPRAQHRRLHALPHRGHRGLRAGGGRDRHRRLPDLRRAQ